MTDLITADQLSAVFSVSPAAVRRWATRTKSHTPCPHRKDARGRLRFDPDAVDEWLTQTGVGKRSKAQSPPPPPPPDVSILDALAWTPDDITTEADDHDMQALHRTLATALHVCRHSGDLPDPPDLDLRNPDEREAAVVFLLGLDPRPAHEWKRIARQALDDSGDDALLKAIHG